MAQKDVMDRGVVYTSLWVGPWSFNQEVWRRSGASQGAQKKIYRARQLWMLNPGAGSSAHFPLTSSFSFISIMQKVSQKGKVPCILFVLATFQSRTPSDRVPLCCQWYDENHCHLWEVGEHLPSVCHWVSWNSWNYTLFPMNIWRQYSQLPRNERYEDRD